jgi:MFS family permease
VKYLRFLIREKRFLAFGFSLAFFSSFGQTFFIGLFGEHVLESFSLDKKAYGACYSLATLASGLTIIKLGRSLDHVDLRRYSVLLCLGLAIACAGIGVASHVAVLIGSLYLLRLTGQGLLTHTAGTSMARYYNADRGTAISIAGLGYPAGEAVLPILAVAVIAGIGWRMTWLSIAGLIVIVMLPLVLWLLRGHGERHEAHVATLAADAEETGETGRRRQWTRGEVLRDVRFYLLLPGLGAPGFIVTGLFFYQGHLVETKGWSLTMFAACLAVFAATQLPSGLLAGALVDRVGARRLLPLYVVPMVAGLLVLGTVEHWFAAPVFMALTGLTAGIGSPIVGAMWAEVYGVRHLGAIRAAVTSILVFATAASPILMGWLIDGGVPMNTIILACAGYAVVGGVLAWASMHMRARD